VNSSSINEECTIVLCRWGGYCEAASAVLFVGEIKNRKTIFKKNELFFKSAKKKREGSEV